MQDRGLAAYIAELVGTLILVFAIGLVVVLFIATSTNAQTGSDYAVVGLVHGIVLFGLIITLGAASGGHFNPAVTLSAAILRRIDPVDAAVYILAQLSGGVLGALLVKAFLLDEGRASHYGAVAISPLLGSNFQGACIEGIGTFLLVLAVCSVAFNPRARHEWAPLAIGLTLGLDVMIFGPLTGSAVNPARWFGPALIGNDFNGLGGTWPYIVGPIVGAVAASLLYRFVIAGPQFALGPEPPTAGGEVVENVGADVSTAARSRRR
ncbi:MAG TPA: aquaporin [Solirubrobacterales bacterium]|nr:aquaporin [Solirubrobacterales bacterium]